MSKQIYIKPFNGHLEALNYLNKDPNEILSELFIKLNWHSLDASQFYLTSTSGKIVRNSTDLVQTQWFNLNYRLNGGKGGLGNQIKAAGRKMAAVKSTNNDECRDLSGRRLKSTKLAQQLANSIADQQNKQQLKEKTINEKIKRAANPPKFKRQKLDVVEFSGKQKQVLERTKDAVSRAVLAKSQSDSFPASGSTVFQNSIFFPDDDDCSSEDKSDKLEQKVQNEKASRPRHQLRTAKKL